MSTLEPLYDWAVERAVSRNELNLDVEIQIVELQVKSSCVRRSICPLSFRLSSTTPSGVQSLRCPQKRNTNSVGMFLREPW